MLGLGFLVIIVFYIWLSKSIGKIFIKRSVCYFVFWIIVALIPVWYAQGHYLYPSYFKFQSLCNTDSTSIYTYDKNIEPLNETEWIVPNRLKKWTFVSKRTPNVSSKYISFSFYPFGTKALFGVPSSLKCPRSDENDEGKSKRNFIKKHMNVTTPEPNEIILEAREATEFKVINEHIIKRGRSNESVGCENKVVGNDYNHTPGLDVSFLHSTVPGEKRVEIEKTVCTNENIYMITTPKANQYNFQVRKYNYQGRNTANFIYSIPVRSWSGYNGRKPLIYFSENEQGMILGIEEFGKEIESKYIYYILPKYQPNKF